MVFIANHPIPHGICSGIGAGRGVRAVCAVLGQAVLHGATAGHTVRSNQRLLLSGIGQIFLRRGSGEGGGSLVHLDGHSSGRSCIFFVALGRGEHPFGFIVVICSWLDCAILPCECAVDCVARGGVLHRAVDREFTVSQRLTIGNLACADSIALSQNGNEFVLQTDMDGQRERLIVRGFDLDGHRANFITLIGACGLVDGQAQLAVFDVCTADGIVCGVHADARLTIYDIAVLAVRRKDSIQKLFQIDLVGLCQIVENILRKLDARQADSILHDGKHVYLIGRIVTIHHIGRTAFEHIIAALEHYRKGKGFSVTGLRRFHISSIALPHGEAGVRDVVSILRQRNRCTPCIGIMECQCTFGNRSHCRAIVDFCDRFNVAKTVKLHRFDFPVYVFNFAGVVALSGNGQRIAAHIGLRGSHHGIILISRQNRFSQCDRGRRVLCNAVIGQALNVHRCALNADRRNGDGEVTAFFVAVLCGCQAVSVCTGSEIHRQLIGAVGRAVQRQRRTADLVPLAGVRSSLSKRHNRCC